MRAQQLLVASLLVVGVWVGAAIADQEARRVKTDMTNGIHPAVIVPGIFGSALENMETTRRTWVNINDFADGSFERRLRVTFDSVSHQLKEREALDPYAGLRSICNITGGFGEFQQLVNAIEQQNGGVSAVPYDWRLVPTQEIMEAFVWKFQAEVQSLYNLHQKRVYIISHSFGAIMALFAIRSTPMDFMNKYVAGFIPVSPPFGGTAYALKAIAYGVNATFAGHKVFLPPSLLGNFGIFGMLFPQQRSFPDPVVTFNGDTYSAHHIDYVALLNDIDFASDIEAIYPWIDTWDPIGTLFSTLPPPIEAQKVHIIVSTYGPTVTAVKFNDNKWSDTVEAAKPYGDGVVSHASLHANDILWDVTPTVIHGVDHFGIIQDRRFIDEVVQILGGFSSPGEI